MLTESEIVTIRTALQVYDIARLQDLVTLLDLIEQKGININQVRDFVAAEKSRMQRAVRKPAANPCPDCGRPMQLHEGDDDDCFWICRSCRYSAYCPRQFGEELNRVQARSDSGE